MAKPCGDWFVSDYPPIALAITVPGCKKVI